MNISNLSLFCDVLVQAVLFPPVTGSTWNAWWSWSAWTCWREGQHFPINNDTTTHVCQCTYNTGLCAWACAPVYVWCVFILPHVPSLLGGGWRSWRPWTSWRVWHCCESHCLCVCFLSYSTSFFLCFLSLPFSMTVI